MALWPVSGSTQSEPIDLFDGQDKMSESTITVEAESSGGDDDDFEPGNGIGGGFSLSFEQRDSSILVPATVDGTAGYFTFDTGASFTSITGSCARAAGVMPPKGAPMLTFSTANGQTQSPIGVVNSLRFGGRDHQGVTFGLCEGCPGGQYKGKPIIGLLGMNVIGRYRTSFDHSRGVIEMSPSSGYSNRWRDVEPFLDIQFARPVVARDTNGWEFTGTIHNRAPRAVRELTLECECAGVTGRDTVKVGARSKAKFKIVVKDPRCRLGFDRRVVDARW